MGKFHDAVTNTVTIRDSSEPAKNASKAQVIEFRR
jgi:hypothetical protein